MKTGLHTHFASGLHALNIFLTVLILGSFWRIAWAHVAANAKSPLLRSLAGQAFLQY